MARSVKKTPAKWRPFQNSFAFYSESATQTSSPVYSGTPEDDNLSVNVWHCSYTVTARPKFDAPFFLLVPPLVSSAVAVLRCA